MIAVDANGADAGPAVVAEGARLSGEPTLVFGHGLPAGDGRVVEAPAVPASDNPVRAVRSNPEASIVQAAAAVADGRAEALVSAGSTGPTLAAATLAIKRLKGVHRPALAVLVPIPAKPVLLLDCGANVEVRPEHLVQFAYMGSAFMEVVMGVDRPSVGLLSVGEESGKGTPDVLEARERLEGGPLNFAGNLEGFDLPGAGADVVVADGFTGNIALKVLEGTSRVVRDAIRDAITSGPGVQRRRAADPRRRGPAARSHRPRERGRGDPAGPAQAGRGRPRQLRPQGHRQRGGAGPAGGGRGHGRPHPRGAGGRGRIAVRARW